MGRKPKILRAEDGCVSIRVQIPRAIWLTVEDFAKRLGVSDEAALRLFMMRVAALLAQGDGSFLGPEWMLSLKQAKDDNFGSIGDGPKVDIDKLHKSTKTKSGFVGVYANGNGFRAMAKVEGAETYIGTFDTAIEAAWRRYLHYKENKIPYGELEVEIAGWRLRGEQGDDMHLAREILKHSKSVGTFHIFEKDFRTMGLLSAEPTTGSDSGTASSPLSTSASSDETPTPDVSHLINEHDNGLINELQPIGFSALPPTFDDDYVPPRR